MSNVNPAIQLVLNASIVLENVQPVPRIELYQRIRAHVMLSMFRMPFLEPAKHVGTDAINAKEPPESVMLVKKTEQELQRAYALQELLMMDHLQNVKHAIINVQLVMDLVVIV